MINDDLQLLYSLKCELRTRYREYKNSVKGLKDSIRTLEQEITKQVLESGETVKYGKITAEYKPTVVITIDRKNKQPQEQE